MGGISKLIIHMHKNQHGVKIKHVPFLISIIANLINFVKPVTILVIGKGQQSENVTQILLQDLVKL